MTRSLQRILSVADKSQNIADAPHSWVPHRHYRCYCIYFWSLITVESFGSGEWIYTDGKWDCREIFELPRIESILRFRRTAKERGAHYTFIRDITAAARRAMHLQYICIFHEEKNKKLAIIMRLRRVHRLVIIEKLYSLSRTAIPIIVSICKFSIFCFSFLVRFSGRSLHGASLIKYEWLMHTNPSGRSEYISFWCPLRILCARIVMTDKLFSV